MNLISKIDDQFRNLSLKSPNPKADHPWHLIHLHADFIELRTLLWDNESFLTIRDAISFYQDFDIDIDFKEDHTEVSELSSSRTEKNDLWMQRFMEIFDLIEEREVVYGDSYPFIYDRYKLKLKSDITLEQKTYIYLLISSNLNIFSKLKPVLTSEFETFSKQALELYLPNIVVEELGENSTYKGNTINKLKAIAEKLQVDFRKSQLENISPQANKEKGVDLIGWLPFDDEIASMIIILGQCACGKNWPSKKSDTSYYEDSYFDFNKLKPIHAMFIPYGLVHYNNEFLQSDKTNNRLIFERSRLIEMIKKAENLSQFSFFSIVDRCIDYENIEV